jgi:YD repeat-containing protein
MRWRTMSRRSVVSACGAVAWAAAWSVLIGSTCTPGIKYLYDENGRLIAVVDDVTAAANNAAIYNYDAAGNITSIERVNGNTLRVLGFSPACGRPSSTVTINGIGMVADGSTTTVKFNNGTAVNPTALDDTRLTVTVPAGATTGLITVLVGATTDDSPQQFVVGCDLPTISSVAPLTGLADAAVTITGTNFRTSPTENRVRFNGREAVVVGSPTTTSIGTKVPFGATSGKVTVATPYGQATSPADFIVPPPIFPEPPLSSVALGSPTRVALGGSTTVSIATAGHVGMALFDGAAGGRVSLYADPATMTFANFPIVKIFAPNGALVFATANAGSGAFHGWIDAITLPQDGTYSVVVIPKSPGLTGSIAFTVYNANDVVVPITTDGTPTTATTTSPGQNARFTFNATAGYRVAVWITDPADANLNEIGAIAGPEGRALKLLRMDGSIFAGATGARINASSKRAIEAVDLPADETYTILVDLKDRFVGNVTVRLFNPVDQHITIVKNAGTQTATLSTIGSNAFIHFHWETAWDNATVRPFPNSFCQVQTLITFVNDATGANQIPGAHCPTSPAIWPSRDLVTGEYTITIDPPVSPVDPGPHTGSITIQVTDF